MLINKLACTTTPDMRILSADVVWEDRDFPAQEVTFEIDNPVDEPPNRVRKAICCRPAMAPVRTRFLPRASHLPPCTARRG